MLEILPTAPTAAKNASGPWGILGASLAVLAAAGCAMKAPPPAFTPVEITAGERHTCAVTSAGVRCWGNNNYGQLGDGTDTDRATAVPVTGLPGGVASAAAGARHTCAVAGSGAVMCWGENHDGQLGDGTRVDRNAPVAVTGLAGGVKVVAAGERHTCAVTSDGKVLCWGNNHYGQLGDGTEVDRDSPVAVSGLTGVAALAAGRRHTCALTAHGGVVCWGANHDGQLGDGTQASRSRPAPVTGLDTGVTAITAGRRHTCALTAAGAVRCWGKNQRGQLGNGNQSDSTAPVQVSGLDKETASVAAGWWHTCALARAGQVKCWGDNHAGQLGDGTSLLRPAPVDVGGIPGGVKAVTAGGHHTCAMSATEIRCWGENEDGQLGDGTMIDTLLQRK